MRFRLLETRGIPAGNASGNFSPPALLARSEERGPWVGGEMERACLEPLGSWVCACERGALGSPPSLPFLHPGRDFQRRRREGAKFRKSLVPIPWKSQPRGFFPPSFSLGCDDFCKVLGCSLLPVLCHPARLPKAGILPGNPSELPTPPPPSRKQKADIRNPFSV